MYNSQSTVKNREGQLFIFKWFFNEKSFLLTFFCKCLIIYFSYISNLKKSKIFSLGGLNSQSPGWPINSNYREFYFGIRNIGILELWTTFPSEKHNFKIPYLITSWLGRILWGNWLYLESKTWVKMPNTQVYHETGN